MMHGCFSLQVREAQVGSVLHHLVHDVDVSLSVDADVNNGEKTACEVKLKRMLTCSQSERLSVLHRRSH